MKGTYLKEPEPYRLLKAENVHFYAHFHQQAEIVYCIAGQLRVMIDGISYTLQKGDAALIFPNQRHFYPVNTPQTESRSFLLLFYPSHTDRFYEQWHHQLPVMPVLRSSQLPDFFPQLWEQFYQVYNEQTEQYLFQAYTALLTAHMMPRLEFTFINTVKEYDEDFMQAAIHYINQHYTENITLTSVAKALGCSTGGLSRMFTKRIGCNFHAHVNSLRIGHAKRLLRASDCTVIESGMLSGFQSSRTFFRNFMENCGQTPSEYRRAAKGQKL